MKATSEIALSTLHSCFKLLAVQAKQTASVDEIDHVCIVILAQNEDHSIYL